jgi:hypothetical protein
VSRLHLSSVAKDRQHRKSYLCVHPARDLNHVCALSCDGERVSTLGLQGGRLLRLFIGAGAAPWVSAAGSVFASEGVPIDVYRIGPEEVIQDLDGRWAQLTGLSPEAALLVRSDHFVGWRADTLPRSPTDELRKVIRQIFARG